MLKVNNRITRKRCEIYSKLTIKTPNAVNEVNSCNSWIKEAIYMNYLENSVANRSSK